MNSLRELTFRGIILGALITVIFTASNVYLGLKVGLTFSSAIPAAVISMAVLRLFPGATILENNMVQSQASAAGTLSSVIFVLPGLLMMGYWNHFPFWLTFGICAAGGMLGVLFSIPLRYAMVVKSSLPYPEGVAAAEILKAGSEQHQDKENSGMRDIFVGGVIAAIITFITNGLRLFADNATYWAVKGKAIFQLPMGFSLALLSAGYLIGISAGISILVGTFTAWGIAIPFLSSTATFPVDADISHIAMKLWSSNVRFIGAGVIAVAAVWTLITLIKPVVDGLRHSFSMLKSGHADDVRTERDLSPKLILIITAATLLILGITFHYFIAESGLSASIAWLLVICAVLFAFIMGFLVAAACGYMAGLVGSSASPLSGIAIIAVIVISLLLLGIGQICDLTATPHGMNFAVALALFTSSTVLAIAAISNDNLQDLKTGYLVKATPWRQQVALLIGCVIGALIIAPVLDTLYQAYGFAGAMPRENMDVHQVLSAPQATLMASIAQGIFTHSLEWTMLLIGFVFGAIIIALDLLLTRAHSRFKLSALAVGLGIYLPATITTPLILGAIISSVVKYYTDKKATRLGINQQEARQQVERKAALIASGLIVGESLVGVILSVIIVISISQKGNDAPLSMVSWLQSVIGDKLTIWQQIAGLIVFVLVCITFIRRSLAVIKDNH